MKKKRNKLVLFVSAIVATAIMGFTTFKGRVDNIFSDSSRRPLGQLWVEKNSYYEDVTWYTLKATNTSGKCFFLSGKIKLDSTGEIIEVGKNIPEWAKAREDAIDVISLTEAFTQLDASFEALDCL